jgi:hypothetical protein
MDCPDHNAPMSAKIAYQRWLRHRWETAEITEVMDIPWEDETKWWTHPEWPSPEVQRKRIQRQMKRYLRNNQ